MTLSNKILIVFFGSILAYTLMAFVEIRIKGETRELTKENSISESIVLDSLKYVVIDKEVDHWISMRSSDEPRLEIKSKRGDLLSKMTYSLKNDTLFITDIEEVEQHYDLVIYIPKSGFIGLKTISSYARLTDIKQKSFSITQVGGRIDLDDEIDLEKLIITSSEGARLELTNSYTDTVRIDINNSEVKLYTDTNLLHGLLENEARIYADEVSDIQLKKDKKSSIRISD